MFYSFSGNSLVYKSLVCREMNSLVFFGLAYIQADNKI